VWHETHQNPPTNEWDMQWWRYAAMQLWRELCEKGVLLQGDYVEKWLHFQLPVVSSFLNKLGDLRTWKHHVFGLIVFPHSSFVFSVPFKKDRSRFHCICTYKYCGSTTICQHLSL
jgi:hypothetical protein